MTRELARGYVRTYLKENQIDIIQLKRGASDDALDTITGNVFGLVIFANAVLILIFLSLWQLLYLGISILSIIVLIKIYLNWKTAKIYEIAEDPDKTYCFYTLDLGGAEPDDRVVNPGDPIINAGIFIVSDIDSFNFLRENLTLQGLKLQSLRYLSEDEENSIDPYQIAYLPIAITKSWTIYPREDIESLIDWMILTDQIKVPHHAYQDFKTASGRTIQEHYGFEYDEELKYDLTCEYGDIIFTGDYSSTHIYPNLKPTDETENVDTS